jgi:hypothetical protein
MSQCWPVLVAPVAEARAWVGIGPSGFVFEVEDGSGRLTGPGSGEVGYAGQSTAQLQDSLVPGRKKNRGPLDGTSATRD